MPARTLSLPLLLVSLSLLLSGCAAQIAAQNAMLDQCMEREINSAQYVTKRVTADQIIKISHSSCTSELFRQGIRHSPEISKDQIYIYQSLAYEKIKKAPLYRFEVKRDEYKNKVSVSGIDYISNSGASENYYTKAALSATKISNGEIKYFITATRSGLDKASFTIAYFKEGTKLSAIPVGGDVNCSSRVFCFWTEGAIVEIPRKLLTDGRPLDFKLSGRTDSDPVVIPSEYISMFISQVERSM